MYIVTSSQIIAMEDLGRYLASIDRHMEALSVFQVLFELNSIEYNLELLFPIF